MVHCGVAFNIQFKTLVCTALHVSSVRWSFTPMTENFSSSLLSIYIPTILLQFNTFILLLFIPWKNGSDCFPLQSLLKNTSDKYFCCFEPFSTFCSLSCSCVTKSHLNSIQLECTDGTSADKNKDTDLFPPASKQQQCVTVFSGIVYWFYALLYVLYCFTVFIWTAC